MHKLIISHLKMITHIMNKTVHMQKYIMGTSPDLCVFGLVFSCFQFRVAKKVAGCVVANSPCQLGQG